MKQMTKKEKGFYILLIGIALVILVLLMGYSHGTTVPMSTTAYGNYTEYATYGNGVITITISGGLTGGQAQYIATSTNFNLNGTFTTSTTFQVPDAFTVVNVLVNNTVVQTFDIAPQTPTQSSGGIVAPISIQSLEMGLVLFALFTASNVGLFYYFNMRRTGKSFGLGMYNGDQFGSKVSEDLRFANTYVKNNKDAETTMNLAKMVEQEYGIKLDAGEDGINTTFKKE